MDMDTIAVGACPSCGALAQFVESDGQTEYRFLRAGSAFRDFTEQDARDEEKTARDLAVIAEKLTEPHHRDTRLALRARAFRHELRAGKIRSLLSQGAS